MTETTSTAIQFPCEFPIKVMGLAEDGFTDLVLDIVARHAADLDRDRVTSRPSRHGKYVSVTLSVEATSQAQLDAIYRDLTSCTKVLMAL